MSMEHKNIEKLNDLMKALDQDKKTIEKLGEPHKSPKAWLQLIREHVNRGLVFNSPLMTRTIVDFYENGLLTVNYGEPQNKDGVFDVQSFRVGGQHEDRLMDIFEIINDPEYLENWFFTFNHWKYYKVCSVIAEKRIDFGRFDPVQMAIDSKDDGFFIAAVSNHEIATKHIEKAFEIGYIRAMKYFLKGRCLDVDVDSALSKYISRASDEETIEVLKVRRDFDCEREYFNDHPEGFSNLKDHAFLYGKKKLVKFLRDRGVDMRSVLKETDPSCPELMKFLEMSEEDRCRKFFELHIDNVMDYRVFYKHYNYIGRKFHEKLNISDEHWFKIIRNSIKIMRTQDEDFDVHDFGTIFYKCLNFYEEGLLDYEFNFDHEKKVLWSIDVLLKDEKHRLILHQEEHGKEVAEYILGEFYSHKNVRWASELLRMEIVKIDEEYRLIKHAIESEDEEFLDLVLQYDKPNEGVFWIALRSNWKYAVDKLLQYNYNHCEYNAYYPSGDVSILEYALVENTVNTSGSACDYLEGKRHIHVLDPRKKYQFHYHHNKKPRLSLFEYCVTTEREKLTGELQEFYGLSMNDVLNRGYLSYEIRKTALKNKYLFKETDKMTLDNEQFGKYVTGQIDNLKELEHYWNKGGRYHEYLGNKNASVWKKIEEKYHGYYSHEIPKINKKFLEFVKATAPGNYFKNALGLK